MARMNASSRRFITLMRDRSSEVQHSSPEAYNRLMSYVNDAHDAVALGQQERVVEIFAEHSRAYWDVLHSEVNGASIA